jgi:L-fuculose-phosphate aldolase
VLAAAREMLRLGLVEGSSGNVSARERDRIHITPAELAYTDMTEADLVTLDLHGAVIEGGREPSSERRVHLAVYAARPDAGALVHTHSRHATAWSFRDEPLGSAVATTRYAPAGSDEIAAAAVDALGDRGAVLLARHGVLALGGSPAAALEAAAAVERQAQAAWRLR